MRACIHAQLLTFPRELVSQALCRALAPRFSLHSARSQSGFFSSNRIMLQMNRKKIQNSKENKPYPKSLFPEDRANSTDCRNMAENIAF